MGDTGAVSKGNPSKSEFIGMSADRIALEGDKRVGWAEARRGAAREEGKVKSE